MYPNDSDEIQKMQQKVKNEFDDKPFWQKSVHCLSFLNGVRDYCMQKLAKDTSLYDHSVDILNTVKRTYKFFCVCASLLYFSFLLIEII